MQILRPDEVEKKYGKHFCKNFFTLVDEENGVGQIVEICKHRGPGEWDVVNRKRAGGILKSIRQDGTTLIMDVALGKKELNFGPVSADIGGQGVSGMVVEGDRVRTSWFGIAGASIGVGACIPQCPDVIHTEYPDNFVLGGANAVHLDIITPKMVRVIIGMDDTDTKEVGASWVVALKLGETCPIGKFIEHRIIQLNPKVPNKTTNCCSTAVSFAVKEEEIPELVEYCKEFIRKESYSKDSVMTVFKGLKIPEGLAKYGWGAKSILYTEEDAIKAAKENGVEIYEITGSKGTIGAVAAIGCFDLGGKAAGIPEDFEDKQL
jgi:methanogenesis imperfect marker protein 11